MRMMYSSSQKRRQEEIREAIRKREREQKDKKSWISKLILKFKGK